MGFWGWTANAAGDVNGDGYGDVIFGVRDFTNGESSEGKAVLHYGNGSGGLKSTTQQYETGIGVLPKGAIFNSSVSLGLFSKGFMGKQKGRLVWEVVHDGEAFSSASPITNSTFYSGRQINYTDLGQSGAELEAEVNSLIQGAGYKWRVRVQYDPATALNGQVYGPWKYFSVQNPAVPAIGFRTAANVFPIELTDFSAEWVDESAGVAELSWITATETNNHYFRVEKSADGQSWSTVGDVQGAGNSSTSHNYALVDDRAFPLASGSPIYYRLKQVDLDGTFSYSSTLMLTTSITSPRISIWPNPFVEKIDVHLGQKVEDGELQLINSQGRVVRSQNIQVENPAETFSFDGLTSLPAGFYYLTLKPGKGQQHVFGMVKMQ